MKASKPASLLLVWAFVWLAAQATLLLRPPGLLATYDLPAHWHLAAVQARHPFALWDDGWYAGYPTYAYPPLAHEVAGLLMAWTRPDVGLKVAVATAYVLAAPIMYVTARVGVGLPPVGAAATTLLICLSPALLRGFLFGQYPTLVAFLLFWGAVTAFLALLRAPRADIPRMALPALLLGLLGSVHLFPVLLLAAVLALLSLAFPLGLLTRRAVPAAGVGGVLAVLPSVPLFLDLRSFGKTPVPHITRTIEMVHPSGMVDWILGPAGLPLVFGMLVLLPEMAGRRWGRGAGLVGAGILLFFLRDAFPRGWLAVAAGFVLALGLLRWGVTQTEPARSVPVPRLGRFLGASAILFLWLALGPAGGLARLLPLSDRLVFDRPLLFGFPFGYLALALLPWRGVTLRARWQAVPFLLLATTAIGLLGFSYARVLATYAAVPGAQGPLPQTTALPADVRRFFEEEAGDGRILPLGLPPIAFVLPDLTGRPLIDGGYNDARQLAPLRRSPVEALNYEKFIFADLRVGQFFLANAEAYRIRWVLTGDRDYDRIVPPERFLLVHESGTDPNRSLRIYRSISEPGAAWVGLIQSSVAPVAALGARHLRPPTLGGGMRRVDWEVRGSQFALSMHGSQTYGWASTELRLPAGGPGCNQLAFRAWSPTGAGLTINIALGGRWLTARPVTPLPRSPALIALALDCRSHSAVELTFSGIGRQRVFLAAVELRAVRDRTAWTEFQKTDPECFRATLPRAETPVTVSVAAFPRWSARSTAGSVRTGSNALGLLTLSGPAGIQEVCLAFPPAFRYLRVVLPGAYLGLFLLALFLTIQAGRVERGRHRGGRGVVHRGELPPPDERKQAGGG
jgi:hypothetical protein